VTGERAPSVEALLHSGDEAGCTHGKPSTLPGGAIRRLAARSANTWSATSRYASARAGSSSERRIQYSKLLKVSSELSSWCATTMVLDETASLAAEVAMPFRASRLEFHRPASLPSCPLLPPPSCSRCRAHLRLRVGQVNVCRRSGQASGPGRDSQVADLMSQPVGDAA
jgi:hypothetical protein